MRKLVEHPDGSIYNQKNFSESHKSFHLSIDEQRLYKLRADERSWQNHETITDQEEAEILKIVAKYNIPEQHEKYLKWVTGSLVYRNYVIESNEAIEIRRLLKTCNKIAAADPVTRITLNINSKEIHLVNYIPAITDFIEALRPVLTKYANHEPPPRLSRKEARIKELTGQSLKNIAYNLVHVIGIPTHKAKDILFRIGALAGYWLPKKPEGKRYKTDIDYRRTKVNKYFPKTEKISY